MKILLVSANREKKPSPVAPLGVLYLAAALGKRGHRISVLDLCSSKDVASDIRESIETFSPDVIGVSIRNIDNLSYPGMVSYLSHIDETVNNLRKNSRAPVILGGSAFSLFPEKLLKHLKCDLGIIGEGERALIQLLDKIEKQENNFQDIDNLIWVDSGKIHRNKITHIENNDYTVSRELIDNEFYSMYGGMGNLQTKRGCAFKCNYCTYPILEGTEYRLRPADVVANEMELANKKYGIKHFFFVDNIFNFPAYHAEEVTRAIIKKGLDVKWSCFANPMNLTKGLLSLMKKSGCENIEFGTDALSCEVLSKLGKSFSIDDVFRTAKLCNEAGIKSAHYVMFGGPGETVHTVDEAFKNIEKLECNAVIVMVGIRIYPGTDLETLALKEGIISEKDDLLVPHFYLSVELPLETLLKKVTEFANENVKCIVPGLGIKSSEKMYEVLRKYYTDGPLWGYLRGDE